MFAAVNIAVGTMGESSVSGARGDVTRWIRWVHIQMYSIVGAWSSRRRRKVRLPRVNAGASGVRGAPRT